MASDTFTRGNETPLAAPWAKPTTTTGINLTSFACINGTASSDSMAYHTSTVTDSQVKLVALGSRDGGPAICMSTDGDCYMFNNATAAELAIFRVDNGVTFNKLATAVGDYVVNDVLRIRRSGGNVIAWTR
jgi:hypothetical protein